MRIVIVGASSVGQATARKLIGHGDSVILIDKDREKLDAMSETMDCGLLAGDGTDPDVLRDAITSEQDILLAMTPVDQDNILACLLGHSLGCERVIPRIGNPQLFALCDELGLDERIAPEEEVSVRVVGRLFGEGDGASNELAWPARVFTFVVRDEADGKRVADLDLDSGTRAICVYRDDIVLLASDDQTVMKGDRVAVVTSSDGLAELSERFGAPNVASD
jgi:trk system potassium uptake protein TrkA